jgi:peptidoglycan/LPS O-acetylase OafA/YrhL
VKSALFNVTLTYVWVPGYSISGIGPAWTLCDEVAFYAVLPAASFLIARAGIRWLGKSSPMVREIAPLVAIIVVTLIFDGLLEAHDGRFGHLRSTLLGLADWFALGMILAVIHVHRRPAGPDRSWLWWAAAPPLYLLLALVGQDGIHHTLTNAIQGAFGFCLVAPAAFRSGGGRNLVERAMLRVGVLRWFGTISYGIYLWQVPWVIWLAETTNPQSGVLSAAGYVACSLLLVTVLGATSYYVVERPFLRRKHRYVATR